MAAKTSWHRCATKLRHCDPMYKRLATKIHKRNMYVVDCENVVFVQTINSALGSHVLPSSVVS